MPGKTKKAAATAADAAMLQIPPELLDQLGDEPQISAALSKPA